MYVADKDVGVISFALSTSVIEYQTLVLRGDLDSANAMLPDIADDQKAKIARFLEGQGYKEEALEVATDPEHRFELALSLGQLEIALELARAADVEHKWKTVGDAALTAYNLKLAEECFSHAKDLGSLLLLYTSSANADGLRSLATQASDQGAHNIAFSALWSVADVQGCIDLLLHTHRTAEAVLFAQTYAPSRAPALVKSWREELAKAGKPKVARAIAQPPGAEGMEEGKDDSDLFPEWSEWLKLEKEGGGGASKRQESLVEVEAEDAPVAAAPPAAAAARKEAAPAPTSAPAAAEEEAEEEEEEEEE